jgi:hypothetical protein
MTFPEEKLIFTIGRMNPPTSGHQVLIRNMMEKALCLGLRRIYIILSDKIDNIKNPLDCHEKKSLLVGGVSNVVEDLKRKWMVEKMGDIMAVENIQECKVIVICMNEPENRKYGKHPILKCLAYLMDKYEGNHRKKESWLFIGEDRMDSYGWISKYSLDFLGHLNIVPICRPLGAISSTYVRELAMEGYLEEFLGEMESIGIVRERGEEIYLNIRRVLGRKILKKCGTNTIITKNDTKNEKFQKETKKRTRNSTPMEYEMIGYQTRSATRRKQGL